MGSKVKISACTIVKNEAHHLPLWLEKMARIADEMVVVDTGSIDNSKLIAQKAGAEVFDFTWCDDFAAAKNYAIDQATGDWLLFLDADEYFSEGSLAQLRDYLGQLPQQVAAVLCKLVNIDNQDEKQIMSSVLLNRIFRRIPSNCYVGKIHEKLINTAGKYQIAYNHALLIYHTGYDHTQMEAKAQRNLELLQQQERTETDSQARRLLMGYLMDAYYGVGDYQKTIEYAHKAIASQMIPLGMAGHYEEVLFMAMQQAGYPLAETEKVLQDAMSLYPEEPLFPLHLGHLYFGVKKYEQSAEALWHGLKLRQELEQKLQEGRLLNDGSARLVQLAQDELRVMEQWDREKLADYSNRLGALTGKGKQLQRYRLTKECAEAYPYLPEWQAEYGEAAGAVYLYGEAVHAYEQAITSLEKLPAQDKWNLSSLTLEVLPQLQQRLDYWQNLNTATGRIKISACLITKNEAEDLKLWLANAAAYAAEIVVADTGSTDASLQVLREFQQQSTVPVQILNFTWIDDFSAAKNFVLAHASCPWISFLDTDETFLYPERVPAMVAAAQQEKPAANSLMLHMFHVNKDKADTVLGQSVLVRLFRNQANLRYRNAVHENLVDSSRQDGKLNILSMPAWMSIRHTGYSTSNAMKKGDRNLRLLEQEIAKNGEGPGHYLYLVDSYEGAKEYAKALKYALKAIEAGVHAVGAESDMYARVLANMQRLHYPQEAWDDFLAKALAADPHNAYFHMAYGNRLVEQGYYTQGLAELKQVFHLLEQPGGNRTSLADRDIAYDTYVCLGRAYLGLADFSEAREMFLKSLGYYPRSPESLTSLYKLMLAEQGEFADYLQLIEAYLHINQDNLAWLCRKLDEAALDKAYVEAARLLQSRFGMEDAALDLYETKAWLRKDADLMEQQFLQQTVLALFALPVANDLRQDCLRKIPAYAQALVQCFDGKITWQDVPDSGQRLGQKLDSYIERAKLQFIQERYRLMTSSASMKNTGDMQAREIERVLDALGQHKYDRTMLKQLLGYLQCHMEPVEIISFLNQLYDKNQDAAFLAEVLEAVCLNQVYLYYGRLAGCNSQTFAMSWGAGRYDLALAIAAARYQCMARYRIKPDKG